MKFEVNIDLNEVFCVDQWLSEDNLKDAIKESIIEKIADDYLHSMDYTLVNDVKNYILKKDTSNIVNKVVEKIVENVERKKAIKEHTPKLRELEQLDKDNREYVEEIVDRVVNKKIDSIIKQSKLYDDISVNIAKKISDAIKNS